MAETLESIASLFGFGEKQPLQPPRFAKVQAVSGDTVSVIIGQTPAEAVRCCACAAGDVVLLETLPNGTLAAVATRGASGGGGGGVQSVTVGTTTTGAAGTSASVVNSGTAENVVLDFTIPQGAQGVQGVQGATGAAAGFGTPTATATALPAGSSPTAAVVASGADTSKVFAFTFGIPEASGGSSGFEVVTNGVAHVFSQSSYTYTGFKFDSGLLVYFVSQRVAQATGSGYSGQYYHTVSVNFPHAADTTNNPPAFIDVPFAFTQIRHSSNLMNGQINGCSTTSLSYFEYQTSSSSFPAHAVDVLLFGHWK